MSNKTEAVFDLVQEVLDTAFSEPFGEDIIRDVSLAIEDNPEWRRRYNQLAEELHQGEVNKAIGRYVKAITGFRTLREVPAERGHIMRNYSKLVP